MNKEDMPTEIKATDSELDGEQRSEVNEETDEQPPKLMNELYTFCHVESFKSRSAIRSDIKHIPIVLPVFFPFQIPFIDDLSAPITALRAL